MSGAVEVLAGWRDRLKRVEARLDGCVDPIERAIVTERVAGIRLAISNLERGFAQRISAMLCRAEELEQRAGIIGDPVQRAIVETRAINLRHAASAHEDEMEATLGREAGGVDLGFGGAVLTHAGVVARQHAADGIAKTGANHVAFLGVGDQGVDDGLDAHGERRIFSTADHKFSAGSGHGFDPSSGDRAFTESAGPSRRLGRRARRRFSAKLKAAVSAELDRREATARAAAEAHYQALSIDDGRVRLRPERRSVLARLGGVIAPLFRVFHIHVEVSVETGKASRQPMAGPAAEKSQ